jgi:hypothetical protein
MKPSLMEWVKHRNPERDGYQKKQNNSEKIIIHRYMITKIKEKIKSWWKWIVGLFIVSAVAAPLIFGDVVPIIAIIDGKAIEFSYTDANSNEDLLIYTNANNFFGLGAVTVYIAVKNVSGKDQNVSLGFSVPGSEKWDIRSIRHSTGLEEIKTVTYPGYRLGDDKNFKDVPEKTVLETRTIWNPLSKRVPFERASARLKEVKGYQKVVGASPVLIKNSEVQIFEVIVEYDSLREFYVEAFGDKLGYGHLDPWTYTQNFESLNTGDLTGQDSWSGAVQYDVASDVAKAAVGTQYVQRASGGTWPEINRVITAVTDGAMEIYVFSGDGTAGAYQSFDLRKTTTIAVRVNVGQIGSGQNITWENGANSPFSVSTNRWYKIRITYDTGTDKYSIHIDDVEKETNVAFSNNVAEIDSLLLWGTTPSGDQRVDDIGPFSAAAAADDIIHESGSFFQLLKRNVKDSFVWLLNIAYAKNENNP